MQLEVRDLYKTYEGAPLLDHISFGVAAGEIVCLLGPSGAGKTTLLRIIAGLETADAGTVTFEGRDLRDVPVHLRGIGLMFQDLALFPHRTVFENVAFGLRMRNEQKSAIRARVNEMLSLVGLDPARFAQRDVNRLSGGEQQRVALARTLAPGPRLVMFDEPLGALDRILREQLVDDLRALLKRMHMTALYVTHDQAEAFAIADRLLILHAGRIQQSGAPAQVYRRPANEFVARLLGLTNLIPAQIAALDADHMRVSSELGAFVLPTGTEAPQLGYAAGEKGYVLLRPRALKQQLVSDDQRENTLRGRVTEKRLSGGHQHIVVETRAGAFDLEWDDDLPLGAEVAFQLDSAELLFLRAQ